MKRIKLSVPQRIQICYMIEDIIQNNGDGETGIYHRSTREALKVRNIITAEGYYSSKVCITGEALEAFGKAGLPAIKSDTQTYLELNEDFLNHKEVEKLHDKSRDKYEKVKEKVEAVWTKKESLMYRMNKEKYFKSYLDVDEILKPLVQEYNKAKQQRDKHKELYDKSEEAAECVTRMIYDEKNISCDKVPSVIFMEEIKKET